MAAALGRRAGTLGLVLLAAAVLLVGLGSGQPLSSHEALLAETARNMALDRPVTLADGSQPSPWLVPNFGGEVRLRKTPLPYWMVAGLARLTGRVDAWTARLPSALAAAGTIALLMLLLRRQHDRRTALLGGAALATSAGFLIVARSALSDMPMTLLTTACIAALWMGVERRGGRRFAWFVLAGAAAGLAMLAKGPAPALVLAGPIAVAAGLMIARLTRARRRGESVAAEWAWMLGGAAGGLVVFAAIALPWPAYVYAHVPHAWEVWKGESFDRATGDYGHQEAIWFYLVRLPALVAPWTVFFLYGLVLAARDTLRSAAARPPASAPRVADRGWLLYAWAWFLGPLAAFSLAAGKQDHYILPLLPAAAAYTGMAMRHLLAPAAGAAVRAGRRMLIGHAVASIALGLTSVAAWILYLAAPSVLAGWGAPPGLLESDVFVALAALGAVGIAGGAAATILARRGRLLGGMAVLFATLAAAGLAAGPTLMGPLGRSTTAARFARRVRADVPREMPLFAFVGTSHAVVFYVERPVPPLTSAEEIRRRMAAGEAFYLVVDDKHAAALGQVAGLREIVRERDRLRPDEGYRLLHWPGGPPPAAPSGA
jgi:4-amino-4-deoxy-L-arabinose transferase-like glycosyltransferase